MPNLTIKIRMLGWLLLAVLLLCLVALVAPQQLPVQLYKLSLVTLACVLGYWIDRGLFPYARPDSFLTTRDWREHAQACGKSEATADFPVAVDYILAFVGSQLRRAIIVAAVVISISVGL